MKIIFLKEFLNMLNPIIYTTEDLKQYLKNTVSETRYLHSLSVADTTQKILIRYNKINYNDKYKNFFAPEFCGLVHDLAREMSSSQILKYCAEHEIELTQEEIDSPILAHGIVSSDIASHICGEFPEHWQRAVCIHTTGDLNMDDLALALFCADFVEPTRSYMTSEKRDYYLSSSTLQGCAYKILCDIMKHWEEKGNHSASKKTIIMRKYLEKFLESENIQ